MDIKNMSGTWSISRLARPVRSSRLLGKPYPDLSHPLGGIKMVWTQTEAYGSSLLLKLV